MRCKCKSKCICKCSELNKCNANIRKVRYACAVYFSLMAKNDCAFAAEFAAIIHFRLKSSEDKMYALTFYWFGSHFITTSMYSQFMLTIFRKIYRLLQPTYLATSSQRGLSLVSSLSLVNFCRKIQEISFHSPKVFLPKLQTTSAPSCFELRRGGREPMKPVFFASRLHLRFRFSSSYV